MFVVFDSNVLVSAFLWQRGLKPIYCAIRGADVRPCFTPATWAELQRVLHYKKLAAQMEKIGIAPKELSRLLASRSQFFDAKDRVLIITEDVSDNDILAAALAAWAEVIVSGDRHLLKLQAFRGIPVLSPTTFILRYLQ